MANKRRTLALTTIKTSGLDRILIKTPNMSGASELRKDALAEKRKR